jgi:dTDP-4-amino-4,6-dideoxygalactose transaminase
MNNVHDITKSFEQELSKYTGSPYVVALDNCCNALFLALYYERKFSKSNIINLPSHTYPGVPCEVKHAGFDIEWEDSPELLKGAYQLKPTKVWDSALRFTHNMYIPNTHMCLSFTGPYKQFKLSKGGAILTDSQEAYRWFKKARFSGRSECSYHKDDFDDNPVIGWNFYMMPELAARGILLINQFYNLDGSPKYNEDLELPYPDLSRFKIYNE